MPETDAPSAWRAARRLCNLIASESISLSQATIQVTASIGIAELDSHITSLEGLLDCSDQVMYLAKAAGRNQVIVFSSADE